MSQQSESSKLTSEHRETLHSQDPRNNHNEQFQPWVVAQLMPLESGLFESFTQSKFLLIFFIVGLSLFGALRCF